MGTKQYRADAITFSWASLSFKGFAADVFIGIARTTPANSSSVGAGGEVTVEGSGDKRKQITLTLTRSSKDNALLTALFQAQELSGTILFAPLTIKDGLGDELHAAPEAWIMTEPDAEFSGESGTLDWIFETGSMKSIFGGS